MPPNRKGQPMKVVPYANANPGWLPRTYPYAAPDKIASGIVELAPRGSVTIVD